MRYEEIQPGPAARRFIKCYWVLEDDHPQAVPQTIVPDGRSELIINLAEPFHLQGRDAWQSQPQIFFVGQITGPFLVRPGGPVRTIGVRFRPHGASRLFGLPMFELADEAVSLTEISPKLDLELQSLAELPSLKAQLPRLENVLLREAEQSEEDSLIGVAVGYLEHADELIRVRELADSLGLSSRQFERRFRSTVGLPPKLFSRMRRFQRVFQAVGDSGANWVDVAVSCGYYDQAHLIRDFREFSGTTPTALLSNEFDLTRHFTS
jgi:AraC-like DNA-binding protein